MLPKILTLYANETFFQALWLADSKELTSGHRAV